MALDYHVYLLSKREKMTCICVSLLFFIVCSYLFYQNMVLVLCFLPVYPQGKQIYAQWLKEKRKQKLRTEFRDFLFSLSTAFATGRHMTEGMKEAILYLDEIYGEKGLMAKELRYMLKAVEETAETDAAVFTDFARRADLEDVYTFADVFHACRDTGGDMVLAVNKAAMLLSEKITLEEEIQTMLAQRKLEGRIIAAMPFILIIFLQWMSPDYMAIMYETLAGRLVMTAALGLTLVTFLWMERMTNIEC